jgi:hypothetical protein
MSVVMNETEAALAEGIAPISKDALALQRRYHRIAARMAPLKLEQTAIKDLLTAEMEAAGAVTLTHKGVPVVAITTVNNKDVDLAGILKEFPGAAKYIGVKVTKRFDAKKPV